MDSEQVNTGIMTEVLNTILTVLSGGADSLGENAIGLLSTLIAIEIVWAGLMWALGTDNFFRRYLTKVIKVGMFAFLTLNFSEIANTILDGFIWAGLELGDGGSGFGGELTIQDVQDPSAIIENGFLATAELFDQVTDSGFAMSGLVEDMMLGFVGLTILVLYFIVALQVFITLVEFYLIASFGVIMVPWGVNKHTAFIAERYFGAILAQGVKLMVVIALLSIVMPVINGMVLPEDPSFSDVMSLAFGMGTMAFLIWRAPNVASGLMTGSANLSASDAVGMGMGAMAAGKAGGMAVGGAAASVATGGAATPAALAATAGSMGGASKAAEGFTGGGSSGTDGSK